MARSLHSHPAVPHARVSSTAGPSGRRPAGLSLLISLRPGQWTKNLLVFAGLLFAKKLFDVTPMGGTVVIEQIFGLPGIGWMILNGIFQRDYPTVQGGVLFVALAFVLINLMVDLLYAYLDPRIRYA